MNDLHDDKVLNRYNEVCYDQAVNVAIDGNPQKIENVAVIESLKVVT